MNLTKGGPDKTIRANPASFRKLTKPKKADKTVRPKSRSSGGYDMDVQQMKLTAPCGAVVQIVTHFPLLQYSFMQPKHFDP